ncbi:hypothetical protein F4553_002375 [Allocatelliglobosispora scoriae]|uniref:CU044_5270 family protein n=1 Tax=Allocatelliglobosispora scoriae TaxID=643052 RepID=A0A841BNX0_9ACTN|nr:CU044_5270 family protein [Allocatelliglobosispora scoriae]MBB5868996.1 hypothetical protein [Allocatelliglobosispora scoriae]
MRRRKSHITDEEIMGMVRAQRPPQPARERSEMLTSRAIVRYAETPRREPFQLQLRTTLKWATRTGAALVVVGLLLPSANATASPATPGPLSIDNTSTTPADEYLLDLAKRVEQRSEPTSTGPYTYTRVQVWGLETGDEQSDGVNARDQRLWWRTDRSAVSIDTPLPPQPPGRRRAEWTQALPEKAANPVLNPPGTFSPLLAGLPGRTRETMREQLERGQRNLPAEQIVRRAAQLCEYYVLDPAQRAAQLRMLADTPGLIFRGRTDDRAGRAGAVVSVDSDGDHLRDILVFDDATGELLSLERVTLKARDGVPANTVIAYFIFLEHSRVDRAG